MNNHYSRRALSLSGFILQIHPRVRLKIKEAKYLFASANPPGAEESLRSPRMSEKIVSSCAA